MPVRDCMTGSPYCPANQESKFAMPGYETNGCDSCVESSLNNNEIPKCFFCKVEEEGPLKSKDFSFNSFAEKIMEMKQKTHR
ncbi:MAG: DUF6485 family protein [Bacillota bacterium]